MKVAPAASAFDGFFDVTVFRALPSIMVPILLGFFVNGKHEKIKYISSVRCKEITIETLDDVSPINMDGEIIGSSPMTFKIKKGALCMFVPEKTE